MSSCFAQWYKPTTTISVVGLNSMTKHASANCTSMLPFTACQMCRGEAAPSGQHINLDSFHIEIS